MLNPELKKEVDSFLKFRVCHVSSDNEIFHSNIVYSLHFSGDLYTILSLCMLRHAIRKYKVQKL